MTSPNAKYFGLKVKGLSMIDKGIFDGDIAVIKKTNYVENGKIAAVITQDNEVTLKTIKFDRNKVLLIPANQSFETKEYEAGEIQVQGTLSGIIRKYN
jgi:repressor LexA